MNTTTALTLLNPDALATALLSNATGLVGLQTSRGNALLGFTWVNDTLHFIHPEIPISSIASSLSIPSSDVPRLFNQIRALL